MSSASDSVFCCFFLRSPIELRKSAGLVCVQNNKPNKLQFELSHPPLSVTWEVILSNHGFVSSQLSSCRHPFLPLFLMPRLVWWWWVARTFLTPTIAPIVQRQQNGYRYLSYLFFLGLKMAASDGDTSVWPPKTWKSPCLSTSLAATPT